MNGPFQLPQDFWNVDKFIESQKQLNDSMHQIESSQHEEKKR